MAPVRAAWLIGQCVSSINMRPCSRPFVPCGHWEEPG